MAKIIDYIKEQPRVLQNVKDPQIELATYEQVFLVGTGSSLNAAFAVKYIWEQGCTGVVRVCDPLSFVHEYKDKITGKSLIVGISQSGASKVTVDALIVGKNAGAHTIGVTAEPDSVLASIVADTVLIPCGEELVGAKTKGYSCTVAVLTKMVQKDYDQGGLSRRVADKLEHNDQLCQKIAKKLAHCRVAYVIGANGHYGTAREIALKTMEIAKIPTLSLELEDSMHGPFNALNDDCFVVVLTSGSRLTERMRGLATILTSLKVQGVVIQDGVITDVNPGEPWEVSAGESDLVADVVPAQLLCWHLALAKGEEPTYFRYDRSMVYQITKMVGDK